MTKRKVAAKKRPARVYFDDKKGRYYIKAGKKRVYFKKDTKYEEAYSQAIKNIKVTPANSKKYHALSYDSKALKYLPGFGDLADSPLIVSSTNAQDNAQLMEYHKLKEFQDLKARQAAEARNRADEALKKLKDDEQAANKSKQEASDKKYAEALQKKDEALKKRDAGMLKVADKLRNGKLPLYLEKPIAPTPKASPAKHASPAKAAKAQPENDEATEATSITEKKDAEEDDAKTELYDSEELKIRNENYDFTDISTISVMMNYTDDLNRDELAEFIKLNFPDIEVEASDKKADLKAKLLSKFEVEQIGSGNLEKQVSRDGLYSDQISAMMKPYKKNGFLGVVSADEVVLLIKPSVGKSKFSFIMNKDKAAQPGSHWVAVYIDLVDDCAIEYFDSLADEPDDIFLHQIKKLIDAHNLDYYLKMKINKIKVQRENGSLCGFHAIKFLLDRYEGKPFKEVSGYDHEIIKGDEKARELMKKYERFGYI